jgi:ribonuclease R
MDFLVVGGVGSPVGQKVLADVVRWDATPPHVSVRRALGLAGVHDTEMRAILADHEFDTDFSTDVAREAEKLTIAEADYAGRRDFRTTLTFTIDPADAKDFDDAISYKKLGNGAAEIGVHIADVSHFVRPDTALDREALARGTSVYLVDRTIPMLPPELSEDLCSLKPEVDRLTYSAVFTVKGSAIVDRWFGRSVIHSTKRLSYEEADVVLSTSDVPGASDLNNALHALNAFSQHLRKKRIEYGALIFDRTELRPVLNEKKAVVGFSRNEPTLSHQLIEELMLLANREVATLVRKALPKKQHVFMYRVHDAPNVEKLEELALFLRAIGYSLTLTGKGVAQAELNRMLQSVKGTPEEGLIKTATIRSMSRATYTTKNIGHYGLSFKDYAHFTSPIRRYPDLLVHRTLTKVLKGEPITETHHTVEEMAVHASEREAAAAEAERESVKLKQCEYLSKKIGEPRHGTISGVTEWGIYVEDQESGGEGMIHISKLPGFEYAPRKFALVSGHTKGVLRLGDAVRYTVAAVDLGERTIDLTLLSDEGGKSSENT